MGRLLVALSICVSPIWSIELCPGSKANDFFSELPIQMVDPVSKLVILTSPKGGATVTAHLVFEYLSLTEKALATSPWIHNYRASVYDKDPFYKKQNPCEVCKEGSEWTCLFIIRSPADRVVSSFIHVLRTILASRLPGYEDVFHKDLSFRDYIDVLMQLRRNETVQFADGHHAAPQDITHRCNGDESLDIKYVAVEFLDKGLGYRVLNQALFCCLAASSTTTSPYVRRIRIRGSSAFVAHPHPWRIRIRGLSASVAYPPPWRIRIRSARGCG